MKYIIIYFTGALTAIILIGLFNPTTNKTRDLLFEQQCAEYNSTTGNFVIRNLLKD